MENKIKEAFKIIFDFNYDRLLNEYLNTNLLATEIDFIDYIATNQNSHLEKLSPQIDFFFNEKINSDTEYENFNMRDEYWFYREYQNYLIEKRTKLVQALPPQPIVKQKSEQETPKIFDELFYNTDLVDPCIDILKELDPPLIDTDCNYIGKLKGVFCVWIDEMQRQGIVKSNYPEERKLFASLIQQKIKRFSIDESMFGKYQSKAENMYRTDIKTKVSKIKLSQDSQQGKQGNLSL